MFYLPQIIFTTRNDEDDWFRSFSNQIEETGTWEMTFLRLFSPQSRKMFNYMFKFCELVITESQNN